MARISNRWTSKKKKPLIPSELRHGRGLSGRASGRDSGICSGAMPRLSKTKPMRCVGARTGQEVCALRESGIEAIGIDLVAFPPYTVEGDIHDLGFSEGEFDLVFTHSFDHALYPAKLVSEMERVCPTDGHIIVNLQVKMPVDDYSENSIHDPRSVSELFVNSTVVEAGEIHNTFDGMNYEFVFKKRG